MKIARYDFQGTCEELLAKLRTAHAEDKTAERRVPWCMGATVVGVIGGIILCVVTETPWPLAIPVVAAGFWYYNAKRDLEDAKLEAAMRVVQVLSADIPSAAPAALTIDFRPYNKGGRLESKTGGWTGPRVLKYSHYWLGLKAKLADGRNVRVGITDSVTRKEKPKRKYTKVRERLASELTIDLRAGARAREAAGRLKNAQRPGRLTLRSVEERGGWLRARLDCPPAARTIGRGGSSGELRHAGGDDLLSGLLWAYQGIAAGPSDAHV